MTLPGPTKRLRALGALGCLVAGGVFAGCSESEVPIIGIAHPTLVEVAPRAFLGDVPCRPAQGAMRRYVATLYDVHFADAGLPNGEGGAGSEPLEFALPSSTLNRGDGIAEPVPCTQSVGFARVVPNHEYRAEIDGYDRDDLYALAPGLRLLYDPATGERVSPRWQTRCGDKLPVTSFDSVTRTLEECEPLEDSEPTGETLVQVSIEQALDGLECGTEPGAVEHFEVELPAGGVESAPCGETMTLRRLAPERSTITLELRAFQAGETSPSWGTQCIADVIEGVTTTATCLPLASTGALEVDPEDALQALGLECSASSFVVLEVAMTDGDDDAREVTPGSCSRPLTFLGRPPGSGTARAMARLADGSLTAPVECTATIVPGATVPAPCTKNP